MRSREGLDGGWGRAAVAIDGDAALLLGELVRAAARVEKLVGLEFDAVYPGHGRPVTFEGGVDEKDDALRQLLAHEPE